LERMAKRSQLGISDGVPAGMYHRLQCSARRVRISVKWLILFGEWAVNEKGRAGATGLGWTINAAGRTDGFPKRGGEVSASPGDARNPAHGAMVISAGLGGGAFSALPEQSWPRRAV